MKDVQFDDILSLEIDLCDDCGIEEGRHVVDIGDGTITVCDECYDFYQAGELLQ